MKNVLIAAAMIAVSGMAQGATVYNDTVGDISPTIGGGPFPNLDIKQVVVSHDATNLYVSVETVGFQSWTKYMMYFHVVGAPDVTGSNGWARPVNLTSPIEKYIGSWVDQPNTYQQNWTWDGFGWNIDGGTTSNDQSQVGANIVKFTIDRAWLGIAGNGIILFDIATSGGGGGDPGVDHLSNPGVATPDWSVPSQSGNFLTYDIPAPGALALVGLGGLVAARRRR